MNKENKENREMKRDKKKKYETPKLTKYERPHFVETVVSPAPGTETQ